MEHPYTLTSMNNLAFTWKWQGRDSETFQLIEECSELPLQVLGINNSNNILYSDQLASYAVLQYYKP